MILVISSPSSSTTGFLTLIFGIWDAMFRRCWSLAATGRGKDLAVAAMEVVGVAKVRAVNGRNRDMSE